MTITKEYMRYRSFTEHSTFDEILHVTKNPKAEKDDARLDPTIQGEGHAEISGPGLASQGGPVFRMILKRKHNINLGIIKPWLRGKRSFDQNVIEALSKWCLGLGPFDYAW